MKINIHKYVLVGTACAVLGGGGIATAANSHGTAPPHTVKIVKHTTQGPRGFRGWTGPQGPAGPQGAQGPAGAAGHDGTNGQNGQDGARGLQGEKGDAGATGAQGAQGVKGDSGAKGDTGLTGATGATGAQGLRGPSGLFGAYYSVASYDVGDTNGGAIATVACKSTSDTAISGGVQMIGLGGKNVPVGSSFPGRMDWSTNTPLPNRLDGWIVQFASQDSSFTAPEKVKVYALCVPGVNIPVSQTYTQSS